MTLSCLQMHTDKIKPQTGSTDHVLHRSACVSAGSSSSRPHRTTSVLDLGGGVWTVKTPGSEYGYHSLLSGTITITGAFINVCACCIIAIRRRVHVICIAYACSCQLAEVWADWKKASCIANVVPFFIISAQENHGARSSNFYQNLL